jgi:tight adherence protein C
VIIVLLIGLCLVGIAFALFARALLAPRLRSAEALRQIDVYGFEGAEQPVPDRESGPRVPALRAPHLREMLGSLANGLGGYLAARIGRVNEEAVAHDLNAAGFYNVAARRFTGYQGLATITLGLLFGWLALRADKPAVVVILLTLLGAALGWRMPSVWIKRRARHRGERIEYEMPDLVDTLVATVEAGIAFSASLQIAAKRFRGALGDELRLTMQEHSMGLSLRSALENMARRQDIPAIRTFVRSLVQGEELGISVGQTLRKISHDMRVRRRQLAEERAHEAPVKIVFPLVLFIFPALLVVILGPALLRIHHVFG